MLSYYNRNAKEGAHGLTFTQDTYFKVSLFNARYSINHLTHIMPIGIVNHFEAVQNIVQHQQALLTILQGLNGLGQSSSIQ